MMWVHEAKKCPLAFAQVREDSELDRWAIKSLQKNNIKILMIASGGCTLAYLSSMSEISRIDVIDCNNSQIALSKFKLKLLEYYSPSERLAILGYTEMHQELRQTVILEILSDLRYEKNIFGPLNLVSEKGPDQIGRYEKLFEKLRNQIKPNDKSIYNSIMHNTSLGESIKSKLETDYKEIMSLANLVRLFGNEATQNAAQSFSKHFFKQTLQAFNNTSFKTSQSPWLQTMLLGTFGNNTTYPWLSLDKTPPRSRIHFFHKNALEYFLQNDKKYGFIHLSNILDWLNIEQAHTLLELVSKSLNASGKVLIRQLNSRLKISDFDIPNIQWDTKNSQKLAEKDRSFFYPKLHLGIKG